MTITVAYRVQCSGPCRRWLSLPDWYTPGEDLPLAALEPRETAARAGLWPDETAARRAAFAAGWSSGTCPDCRTVEERGDPAAPAAVPPADQTALRDRIATAIIQSDGVPSQEFVAELHWTAALREADAVMAVLRNLTLRELEQLARPNTPPSRPKRPRCPHCNLPHDLTPGGLTEAACQSIRARIAAAEQRHTEGDHGGCAAVDCETVRARREARQDPTPDGEAAMLRPHFNVTPGNATVDPAMCPSCKGDNQEAFALCPRCAAVSSGQPGADRET
ncbi:hypothetical protein [Streptomyces sp. STR69]|uniref:hypothetical protein n=1 Tax=Streptomyces sp. STR69 TaxID=1796942 RepID=UPI0021C593E9|nr:hypothetical protein [Streptomyces sp. STR69]